MPTNPSSFFLSAAVLLVAMPSAFAQVTTFNVDMSCAPDFDNVFVTGPWCGWCANMDYNTLTDSDGDGVYTVTLDETETVAGTIEYKYAINGFADQENLVNDMIDGASCAPITDFSLYANRQTQQGSINNDHYGTCDGTCNDVPPVPGGDVLFRVDMSGYPDSFTTVNLNGSFNGWCGSCATMTDENGDSVYELSVSLNAGFYEYKFTLDGWTTQEEFSESDPCTSIIDGYINRNVEVLASTNVELDVVCWNSCEACGFVPTAGCTDAGACNYDPGATEDDGSCEYESCIEGNVLFYESFSNGFDGSNGNGAWTVSDNQDGRLWVWVAPDGQGIYPGGEATGSTHPGGAYSTNIGPLESTTAGDGWMIFDNDHWHGGPINANNPAFDTEGSLTSPWMDFSSDGSVIVNWESYFRYCCFPYAPIFLEVGSTVNGVTSWTTFDAHGDFIESANSASANPLPVSLDVSCVAAYQDSVQLRFAYRQAPETGQGYSHYYWGIDDVTVTSNTVPNDLEITQVTNGDVFSVWEYRLTPFEQAIEAADGGLVAGVMYKNAGTETQYGVDVLVEILDEDSMQIFSVTETIGTVYSYAQAPTCPTNSQDTLYVQTGWEPPAPGGYSLRISLVNDDDATPLTNVMAKEFLYTEGVYGHDNEAALDTTELAPRENDEIPGFFDPTGYGSYYHCPSPGSVAYGIAVKFGPNTGLNVDGGTEPFEFTSRLYTLDGSTTITESPFDEAYWVFDSPPNPTGDSDVEIYLAFDDPIELGTWSTQTGGNFYFAGVISEFESPSQLTVLAESNSDTDNSTGVYSQTGDGDFVWFTSQTSTPAIRLITSPFEAGCTDEMACNFDPTSEVSDGSCLFVGQQCNDGLFSTLNDVVTENCQCEGDSAVYGCTDPVACNFDAQANIDDGSCCICFEGSGASGLLFGSWKFSSEAGAVAIGSEPGSSEWYSSPAGALVDFQYDDRWSLTEDGEFLYNNNGGTMNPFDGYIETQMSVEPSTYTLEVQAGPNGEDVLTINELNTSIGQTCGWMGVWDSGPTYTVVELTSSRLVLSALQQQGDCINPVGSGYFTLIFLRDSETYDICPVPGCTDSGAFNYDPAATVDDGTCVYFATSCEFIGQEGWGELETGLYSDSTLWHYQGAEVNGEWVLHMPELVVEPASGSSFAVMEWSNLTMSNMPPGLQPENMPSLMTGGEQVCVSYFGIPSEVGLYPVLVSGELTISLFGAPYVVGPYNVVGAIEVLSNPNPIAGCTYGNAANYVVYANMDDGSCVFAGCTEEDADNYQPLATVDDGTCVFGECEALCPADINGDGAVNTNDLLGLLGYFGLPCEE